MTALAGVAVAMPAIAFSSMANDVISGYYTLEEYIDLRPEQEEISRAFSAIVRADAAAGPVDQARPARVLIVYPGLQVSDYWRRSVDAFSNRMAELGLSVEIADYFTRPATAVREQSQFINEGLARSPDYMVFTLDALRHQGMIKRVLSQTSTKVILQNITTPIKAFGQVQPFLYVGFDHARGARMLADRVKRERPDGARFAILYGPEGYVSTMRGGVFLKEMEGHGDSTLVASYYVNFDRERAYLATKDLLARHGDLDLIYACSTDIALGVIDALKELGRLDDILVNGWGGGSPELEAMVAGELDFTVMRMNDDNGVAMAEAIRLDLAGDSASVPTVFSGDFVLIDQQTSAQELDRLKAYAFRYSN